MINIFVHGTLFFFLKLPFAAPFFCSPSGLLPVKQIAPKYQVNKISKLLSKRNPKKFALEDFYSFGWSGQLSHNTRNEVAHRLYHHILDLICQYKRKYKKAPFIRIITHSHGGNIALQLGEWAKKHKNHKFVINELVLLACPVQEETKNFIKDVKRFKKVYSLYSPADMIQVMDPQGIFHIQKNVENNMKNIKNLSDVKNIDWWSMLTKQPLFSERIFPNSKNLIQASVQVENQNLIHIDFLRLKFFKTLPDILTILDQEFKKPFLSKNNYTHNKEIKLNMIPISQIYSKNQISSTKIK